MTTEKVMTLQSICTRLLALVDDTTFSRLPTTSLPTSLSDLVEQLRQEIKLFVRVHEPIMSIRPEWIHVSSSCRIDYATTFTRCIEATDATTGFELAAVNALHQRCVRIWSSLDFIQRAYLNGSPNPVVVAAAWRITARPYVLFYEDACLMAARNGWLRALRFWLALIGGQREPELDLESQEMALFEEVRNDLRNEEPEVEAHLLPQNDEHSSLVARLVIIAVKHQQWHVLKYLPVGDVDKAFYQFFPDGRIRLPFLLSLASSPYWVHAETHSIARSLLNWAPRMEVERLRREIENDTLLTEFIESL